MRITTYCKQIGCDYFKPNKNRGTYLKIISTIVIIHYTKAEITI